MKSIITSRVRLRVCLTLKLISNIICDSVKVEFYSFFTKGFPLMKQCGFSLIKATVTSMKMVKTIDNNRSEIEAAPDHKPRQIAKLPHAYNISRSQLEAAS